MQCTGTYQIVTARVVITYQDLDVLLAHFWELPDISGPFWCFATSVMRLRLHFLVADLYDAVRVHFSEALGVPCELCTYRRNYISSLGGLLAGRLG